MPEAAVPEGAVPNASGVTRTHDLVALLHADGHVKVWSLIVSIFGDAILPRGGTVSALTLKRLTGMLGVSDGARRTALSRLSADGWIETARVGRHAFYRLVEEGRETFERASARIYAAPVARERGEAILAVLPEGADAEGFALAHRGLRVDARTVLLDESVEVRRALASANAAFVRGDARLAGLGDLAQAAQFPAYRAPLDAFRFFEADDEPDAAIVARIVLVHLWRRQALRERDLPAGLADMGDRELVARTYRRLLPASERWLDAHATGPAGPLAASDAVRRRFAGTVPTGGVLPEHT